MNPTKTWTIACLAAFWLASAPDPRAEDKPLFRPDLSLTAEAIASETAGQWADLPQSAPELAAYPVPADPPRELLTKLPGKEPRQVAPLPLARAWWKYPFYLGLGLPRDLVDMVFGGINYLPFVNLFIPLLPYELVPTQIFVRDPRDWHRWPPTAGPNGRNHGMYDGSSWGWFPSLNAWHFTYPSQRKARRNMAYNEKLQEDLAARNRAIEAWNQTIGARRQTVRAAALAALKAGNAREAALRMLAYYKAYPLDEGAFALFATALAMSLPDGPPWSGPLLWSRIETAQPEVLLNTERLMKSILEAHPDSVPLAQALIYTQTRLGQGQESGQLAEGGAPGALKRAQNTANQLLSRNIRDPKRLRLVFETSLALRDAEMARATLKTMRQEDFDPRQWSLMQVRLSLLEGNMAAARQTLEALRTARPGDPYVSYGLGCVELAGARGKDNPQAEIRRANELFDQARLGAPGQALRDRADAAHAWTAAMLKVMEAKPELFPPAGS